MRPGDSWGDYSVDEKLAGVTVAFLLASIAATMVGVMPTTALPFVALTGSALVGVLVIMNLASRDPRDILWSGSVVAIIAALISENIPVWVVYAGLGAIGVVAVRERSRFIGGST